MDKTLNNRRYRRIWWAYVMVHWGKFSASMWHCIHPLTLLSHCTRVMDWWYWSAAKSNTRKASWDFINWLFLLVCVPMLQAIQDSCLYFHIYLLLVYSEQHPYHTGKFRFRDFGVYSQKSAVHWMLNIF